MSQNIYYGDIHFHDACGCSVSIGFQHRVWEINVFPSGQPMILNANARSNG